jgi:rubrerythrin
MKHRELATPDQILQAALAREEQSRDFYGDLVTGCQVDFVRELLVRLQGEESKHVRLIQDMIAKFALGKDIV